MQTNQVGGHLVPRLYKYGQHNKYELKYKPNEKQIPMYIKLRYKFKTLCRPPWLAGTYFPPYPDTPTPTCTEKMQVISPYCTKLHNVTLDRNTNTNTNTQEDPCHTPIIHNLTIQKCHSTLHSSSTQSSTMLLVQCTLHCSPKYCTRVKLLWHHNS